MLNVDDLLMINASELADLALMSAREAHSGGRAGCLCLVSSLYSPDRDVQL